ncbi:hypothetical protein FVP74_08375 [Microbacterium saccharophilum]|uniref:Uncharacterized protein n=1 Tax=Microbacterium saccharophilum TaxID=1213358 RepID=A0A5C8HXV5_9MICO|nr:hypothetical protein [Microbacterium saccharophilum]TXK11347.1 hypothetical protein FVP74_08375 [Microbacterium saccharophilum]GEP48803.1 hypothetical protein MSA03_23110 [Microbacterium saccharophilum]
MGYKTAERMKTALRDVDVTRAERAVLVEMSYAVADDSTIYSWGHARLADVLGKAPGSIAAKSALSQRIIPSLIAKRLITKTSDAYRGHNAEYELTVLCDLEMGSGRDEWVAVSNEMGSGSEDEWVAVSDEMGSAQTATPLTTHYLFTNTHTHDADDEQMIVDRSSSSAHDLDDSTIVTELIETATDEQIETLSDLYSQRLGAPTPQRYVEQWRTISRADAHERIERWQQRLVEDRTTEYRVAHV